MATPTPSPTRRWIAARIPDPTRCMTKFIFHGGGIDPKTKSNDSFYKELVKDVPEGGTVLLVYFASRTDDNTDRIDLDTEKCKEFAEGKSLHITVATPENFISQISAASAIWFRGGSTNKLLAALRAYPNLKEQLIAKTVAGSSAGAYALSSYFSSHYEDIAAKGLGIVPARVITHLGSATMPPRPGAIEALKNTAQELPLIELHEGEWRVVQI